MDDDQLHSLTDTVFERTMQPQQHSSSHDVRRGLERLTALFTRGGFEAPTQRIIPSASGERIRTELDWFGNLGDGPWPSVYFPAFFEHCAASKYGSQSPLYLVQPSWHEAVMADERGGITTGLDRNKCFVYWSHKTSDADARAVVESFYQGLIARSTSRQ